jgi:hypothetical protein
LGSWDLDEVGRRKYAFPVGPRKPKQFNWHLREQQRPICCRANNRGAIRSFGKFGKHPSIFLSQFAMLNHNGCSDLIFFRSWHESSTVMLEHLEFHSLLSANSMQVYWFRTEVRCRRFESYSPSIGNLSLCSILFFHFVNQKK